jgi:hypothetical protein
VNHVLGGGERVPHHGSVVFRTGAVLAVLAIAGCGGPDLGFGVALTLRFDDSVGEQALAGVTELQIVATGDEGYDRALPLTRAAQRVERLVYRPGTATQRITLSILATDAAGQTMAAGSSGEVMLVAGKTRELEIVLSSGTSIDLGGLDFTPTDLAGVDLSAPDLASVDLAPTCPPGRLCEDFEVDLQQWNLYTMGATGVVDTTRPHGGARSYHVTMPAVTAGSVEYASLVSKLAWVDGAGNDFWLRAWVYFESAPNNNFALFGIRQKSAPSHDLALERIGGSEVFIRDEINGSGIGSGATVLNGGWRCLELHVTLGATGSASVAVDSTLAPTSYSASLQPDPAFAFIGIAASIGAAGTDDQGTHEIWFDDVVASPTRAGCD